MTPTEWKWRLGALILTAGIALGWIHEHDARVRANAEYDVERRVAEARVDHWQGLWTAAAARVVHDSVRVTRTTTRLDTLWRDVPEELRTRADTLLVVSQLPVLRAATDSSIRACSEYQVSCSDYRRATDSLVVALKDERELDHKRLDVRPAGVVHGLGHGPRLSGRAEALWDPLAQTPAGAVAGAVRVAGDVALTVRLEQRFAPGERPRLYLGLARAF